MSAPAATLPADALTNLCTVLAGIPHEPPNRWLAGFAEALSLASAAILRTQGDRTRLWATSTVRLSGSPRSLADLSTFTDATAYAALPNPWAAALADGRAVRGVPSALDLPLRTSLGLGAGHLLYLHPIPTTEGLPGLVLVAVSASAWTDDHAHVAQTVAAAIATALDLALLREVLDHLPQQVAWKDASLRYRGANRSFLRAAEQPWERLKGQSDAELTLPPATGASPTAMHRDRLALTGRDRDTEKIGPSGERCTWFDTSRVPLASGGLLVVRDDISTRTLWTEQLQRAQRLVELAALGSAVSRSFTPLCDAVATAVKAGANHLAPPLRAAETMVRHLALFDRRQVCDPVVLFPAQVINRLEPTLRRLLGPTIELVSVAPGLRCAVRIDIHQFEQAVILVSMHLQSLLGGAGRISIELTPETVAASDAAALAMAPGEYMHLGLHSKTSSTPEPAAAEPLPLALARTICAQAGGWIHSAITPESTVISIRLPRLFIHPKPPATGHPVDLRGSERLLVLDDAPVRSLTLATILEALGYTVVRGLPGPNEPVALVLLAPTWPGAMDLAAGFRHAQTGLRVLWLRTTATVGDAADTTLLVPTSFEQLALRIRQALDERNT